MLKPGNVTKYYKDNFSGRLFISGDGGGDDSGVYLYVYVT